jgi:hypothetical protein
LRVIELRELVTATFYLPGPNAPAGTNLVKVPRGIEYDALTMVQRKFAYRENIEGILSQPPDPRAGVKVVEIRKAIKILDALEAVEDGKPLILEDDQWSYLDSRVENTDWPFALPAVITFTDDIHNAKAISKERLEQAAEPRHEPTPISRKNGKAALPPKEAVTAQT